MSHVTTYKNKIKDINLLFEISKSKYHAVIKGEQEVFLYGAQKIKAIGSIKIPSWQYAIAVMENGDLLYDNFGSERSSMDDLGELLQDYNEKIITKNIDYSMVNNYTTEILQDGSKKLTLIMEG